jgi:hypothetical protein
MLYLSLSSLLNGSEFPHIVGPLEFCTYGALQVFCDNGAAGAGDTHSVSISPGCMCPSLSPWTSVMKHKFGVHYYTFQLTMAPNTLNRGPF